MHFFTEVVSSLSLLLVLVAKSAAAQNVDPGYDVSLGAQVMVNLASHSWEWGTAAEALLELYNNELSVFGPNPFPGGHIPNADPGITALAYAKPFISTVSAVFVANSAVGDPASLGVSALLLAQSESQYIGASQRQADYILNQAPKYSNGAISQRPDVAELWADFNFMAPPFLAYFAVQQNNASLMAAVVAQFGLQRAILKSSSSGSWQHIIGPQSQDTGLWSTGNGWACYGMIRVLNTLQKWSGSSGMTSQASQLQGWIKEILDGAIASGSSNGLLRNYLNDASWFGEISGTSLLTACAYRMAVNAPGTFGQSYITWADANRKAVGMTQASNGIFSPAVDPYSWGSRTQYTTGSPEGQAFTVFMYTAYRDCVNAGVCAPAPAAVSTISHTGIGPIDIITVLDHALTFTSMTTPPTATCGAPQSCDLNGCAGTFPGLTKYPVCTGNLQGCQCIPTNNTCGAHQSCDNNGCAGLFSGLTAYATCTGNFVGCQCTATTNTCGAHQSCDLNGCAGAFTGLSVYPQCTGNFIGCQCTATAATCGASQSCDLNGCAGAFSGVTKFPQCTGNFVGCRCTATSNTCGAHQSCDSNGCAGAYNGISQYPRCTNNFIGCECTPTTNTCGSAQSCDLNGCAGVFNLGNGKAYCSGNFVGCQCAPTANTCGNPQSCDNGNCGGQFVGAVRNPQCTNFFQGCQCLATSNTCGSPQSCDSNGCAGTFSVSTGKASCSNNFVGCGCTATPNTCGQPQSCDNGNCAGSFSGLVKVPTCTNFFKGCVCSPTSNTCGPSQSCDNNGCAGAFDSHGVARCAGNFVGCPCTSTSKTCGTPKNCDLNGCNGQFISSQAPALCTGAFSGCPCLPVASTCGSPQCNQNGCNGVLTSNGWQCTQAYYTCPCTPPSIPPPPPPPPPPSPTPPPPPQFPACSGVDISSLNCNVNCCGFIPCPDWCNAYCGGVDPACR